MSGQYKISGQVLSEMHNFIANEILIGQAAPPADLLFIADGSWLKDTAVIDAVRKRYGAWDVILVFAYYKKPLQLIVRYITRCYSEQKALASAFYIRKQAAMDSRGTLCVFIENLDLCNN
jgi:hypothetical protein